MKTLRIFVIVVIFALFGVSLPAFGSMTEPATSGSSAETYIEETKGWFAGVAHSAASIPGIGPMVTGILSRTEPGEHWAIGLGVISIVFAIGGALVAGIFAAPDSKTSASHRPAQQQYIDPRGFFERLWDQIGRPCMQCPRCGYIAVELTQKVLISRRNEYRNAPQVEEHRDRNGNFTGTTQTTALKLVSVALYKQHVKCKVCKLEDSFRKEEIE